MKILIDAQAAQGLSARRGLGVYTRHLIDALCGSNEGGHEIIVLLNSRLSPHEDELYEELIRNPGLADVVFWPGGIPAPLIWDTPTGHTALINGLVQNWFIARLSPDCVIYPGFMENGLEETSLGLDGAAFRSIVVHHDFIQMSEDFQKSWSKKSTNFRRILSRSFSASGFIFISEFTSKLSEQYLPNSKPSVVAYPPLNSKLKNLSNNNLSAAPGERESLNLLFMGGTEGRKNLFFLLRAIMQLSPEIQSKYRLNIVGPSSAWKKLAYLAFCRFFAAVPLKVKFHGYVSEIELNSLFANSDLFILPSKSEGFGLPAFEALLRGTPLLVARNTALAEVAGYRELTFELELQDLAAKLSRFHLDADFRAMLGTKSRRRFSELNKTMAESGNTVWSFIAKVISVVEFEKKTREELDKELLVALESHSPVFFRRRRKRELLKLLNRCSFILELHENRSRGLI